MHVIKLIIRVPVWPFIWLFRLLTGDADWASVHARILPFGSAIGTYLVANLAGEGEWAFWRNWDAMMEAAGLGVIGHGIAAVLLLEGGIKLGLYVVDKWKADRAKMMSELREQVVIQVRQEIRSEVRREIRSEIQSEVRREILDDVAEQLRRNPDADATAIVDEMLQETKAENGRR